ncbi:type 2 isopentenyl-diphosphate Delta-isomerase [Pseudalkalibacillus caeni]|uniref:Isopentenyl-diphosphate delta-isomerase n=1 Tax=Exobacillus caeni TaxID=2574798 RepID=A0A5R9F1R0_9BACL|nr:type 2 isopentenyl-diphosphate Delta-isomerase [Pseudalkalibacillus caeni]TLS37572.1 type 2 isopentenyl-diphosphate Delta-isomerase [Pseudalkalibacillus caeni]
MKPVDDKTERRKTEHIRICLNEDVEGKNITTGLEKYRFKHNALPEIDFKEINLGTSFLSKQVKAPFLISSMTGGTKVARNINQRLALLAESHGWAIGVGSMRAAIEEESLADTFEVRKYAPTIPVLANLGAVQFNYGYGTEECMRAVEMIEADALILHLNSLQEVFQPEGDTNFGNLLTKIEEIAAKLPVPVGVKEVGMGINGLSAKKLMDSGVKFIDIAGAGGTSWIQVEKFRANEPIRNLAADAFSDWGNPTAECLEEVKQYRNQIEIIASGGMKNGVEAAKALALGANMVGFGRSLLKPAVDSDVTLLEVQMDRIEFELRTAMFGIGADSIEQLVNTRNLYKIS